MLRDLLVNLLMNLESLFFDGRSYGHIFISH